MKRVDTAAAVNLAAEYSKDPVEIAPTVETDLAIESVAPEADTDCQSSLRGHGMEVVLSLIHI